MIGKELHKFARKLWGYNRSITGEGVRQTLSDIKNILPELEIFSVNSGKQVYDWKIPKEWKVNKAYILCPNGEKICDFSKNNLHLVGYSIPYSGKLNLSELQKRLFSLPEQPNAIPYVTSYYQETWGFCIEDNKRKKLENGIYEVVIDSELFDGVLNYGELLIEGRSKEEIFLSTYVCHPSMANNELSGPVVTTFIAEWLSQQTNRFSYRIVFIPETIGSICYLSHNLAHLKKFVTAGFNISCIGDNREYSFLPSRNGKTLSDKVAKHVLSHIDQDYKKYSWSDRGSDERQYCSPGVDLPIASIMRTKYGKYPEYHTSLDDLENVVTEEGLDGGYWALRRAIECIEINEIYKAVHLCEPQMGRRGLWSNISMKGSQTPFAVYMDLLSWCDGKHSVIDIAEKMDVPCWVLKEAIDTLVNENLISLAN